MTFAIRPTHLSDLPWLYRICLLTGAAGEDATPRFRDPDLLGHIFAAPYAVFEPQTCFVLTRDGAPCGYVLGAPDSAAFAERCEREWYPALRARYPLLAEDDASEDASMIRSIHASRHECDLPGYPAHLHIDLLPHAQGQGWGRKMIQTLAAALRERGVPGVHLGVGARNTRAIAFYQRVGFHAVERAEWGVMFGMDLG